jgi:hypothetical protein
VTPRIQGADGKYITFLLINCIHDDHLVKEKEIVALLRSEALFFQVKEQVYRD